MKTFFGFLFLALSLFGGIEEDLSKAWAERDTFSVKFTRKDISFLDTVVSDGIFAVREPEALYKTDREFVLFSRGFLWTFSEGSDVGMKSEMSRFEFADIDLLLAKLHEDFELTFSEKGKGYSIIGTNGTGNIISFTADLDELFLPKKILWTDVFGYKTIISFGKFNFKNPGNIFKLPKGIEFIEQ